MIFSRGGQAALAIVSTFALTQAKSSNVEIKFDKCVTECVGSAGCSSTDVKCMCSSARDKSLLDIVAQCLYFHCIPDLKKFDSSFMDIIVDGCKEFGKAIPQDDIDSAEATAELFVQKLAAGGPPLVESTTVAKPTSTSAKALTTMTTSPTKKGDSTTAKPTSISSAQTTETDDETSNTTASSTQEIVAPTTTDKTPQSTTLVMATGSPTKSAAAASTTAAQSASTKCDSTDPFGNPCPDSAAVRGGMSWVLAGLPVVVALMMR